MRASGRCWPPFFGAQHPTFLALTFLRRRSSSSISCNPRNSNTVALSSLCIAPSNSLNHASLMLDQGIAGPLGVIALSHLALPFEVSTSVLCFSSAALAASSEAF